MLIANFFWALGTASSGYLQAHVLDLHMPIDLWEMKGECHTDLDSSSSG